MTRAVLALVVLALVAATAQAVSIRPIADIGYLYALVSDPAPCGEPPYTYRCGKSETIYYVRFSWGWFQLNMDRARIWTSEPLFNYVGTGKPLCFVGHIERGVFYAWLITDRLHLCRRPILPVRP